MNMSYKRAWELVSEINRSFEEPLVTAQTGGRSGGGAVLTPRGSELIRHYRAIERKALSATAAHLKALQAISRAAGDNALSSTVREVRHGDKSARACRWLVKAGSPGAPDLAAAGRRHDRDTVNWYQHRPADGCAPGASRPKRGLMSPLPAPQPALHRAHPVDPVDRGLRRGAGAAIRTSILLAIGFGVAPSSSRRRHRTTSSRSTTRSCATIRSGALALHLRGDPAGDAAVLLRGRQGRPAVQPRPARGRLPARQDGARRAAVRHALRRLQPTASNG